jgi:hypothetical protein
MYGLHHGLCLPVSKELSSVADFINRGARAVGHDFNDLVRSFGNMGMLLGVDGAGCARSHMQRAQLCYTGLD